MKRMNLSTAREDAGLTQDALAAKSGVSQATISRLESGMASHPTFYTVDRLARALRLEPSALHFGMGR